MEADLKKIHDKINKLIRLEEGAREIGSMEEAANAAAQVQKLLLKYNLDRSQIEPEKQKENIANKEIHIDKRHGFKKTESDWMLVLANIISVNNMCRLVLTNRSTMSNEGIIRLVIFGEKGTIEQVEYFIFQMILRIKSMRSSAYKERIKTSPTKKNSYYRSYSRACTEEISLKFREMKEEVEKEYKGGSQIMVVNNELLAKASEEYFGRNLKTVNRRVKLGNMYGALDGRRDGSNISIHKGLD